MHRLQRLLSLGMMGGGGAAVAWTPAQITDVIWFRSDSLDAGAVNDGDAVTTMIDKGVGAKDVTQGTAGNRPTLQLNEINTLPVIRLDGTSDYLSRADGFPINADYSVYVVAKINDFTKQNNLVAGSDIHSLNLGTTQYLKGFHANVFMTSLVTVGAGFSVLGITYINGNKAGLLHINRATVGTGIAGFANTNAGLFIGAFNGNYWAAADIADIVIAPSALDNATRDKLMAYATARYAIAAASPTISHIICEGDSLTFGFGLSAPATEAWPAVFVSTMGAGWMATNTGVSGKTIDTIAAQRAANLDHLIDTAIANKPTLVIWAGTNDLAVGTSAADAYADLTSIVAGVKAACPTVRVIVLTMIKRGTDAGLETRRGQYNALMLANTAGADAVVDVGADAAFDDVTDATYYQVDEIHITAAGHTVVAGLVVAAYNAL